MRQCREQEQAVTLNWKDHGRFIMCTFVHALKILNYVRIAPFYAL